ncbi:MAG: YgcG family protein [Gammaproteobacteria bacterium]|nr:YgcG family protein [Gammaproteobacteria bacterium]MBU1482137.1 YgcG family protein [Gammaproteobacteria bacterium]
MGEGANTPLVKKWRLAIFVLLAWLLCGTAQAEVDVPVLKQRVTDLTGTLDAGQKQLLENKLKAFESGKGSQIAVLMLPSTQPETIEQFGIRVADAWKLGRKGVDDGVLLLIAKDDRKLRIEVGYGLEGALNDATAKRIVSEIITPYFKSGEFYAGIDAGVSAIIKVVEGEPLPPPAQRASPQSGSDADSLGNMLGAGFIIFILGNIILRQMLGRLPSGLIVGGVIGVLAWVILSSLALAIFAALVAFVFSLIFGLSGRGSSFPGGWGGGGWGSGGGSFGGGGFSGGGGGFGGGGASGGW